MAGTVFDVVNDRLRVEHPPDCWPTSAETGWQEYHDKADKTFEVILAFNKTVFEGSATSQAFEWDICMENKWPRYQRIFRDMWNEGNSGQGVGRSHHFVSGQNWNDMYVDLPHSNPVRLHQSDYVAILMRGEDTRHAAGNIDCWKKDKIQQPVSGCTCMGLGWSWEISLRLRTSIGL